MLALASALALIAVACGGSGGGSPKGPEGYGFPVQEFPDVDAPGLGPRGHFPVGQTFDGYNSNPPTNGPHAVVAAPWGIAAEPVPKEVAVHNLEHAGVVVWYNCAGGPQPLDEAGCQQLENGLAQVVQDALSDGKKVLMTEYGDMEHRIALTAWQYLDAFDEFDGARVRSFIDAFECYSDPENAC